MKAKALPQLLPQLSETNYPTQEYSESTSQFQDICELRSRVKRNSIYQFSSAIQDTNFELRRCIQWADEAQVTCEAIIKNADIMTRNAAVMKRKLSNSK